MATKTTDAKTEPGSFGAELIAGRDAAIDLAYRAILDGEPLPVTSDPGAVRSIMERIRDATSIEQVLRAQEVPSWSRDYMDQPVKLLSFHLNPSGFEQGSSVYAVAEVVPHDTGEAVTVTVGGANVLVQLVKLAELQALPRDVRLIGKRTAEGFTALWLQDA